MSSLVFRETSLPHHSAMYLFPVPVQSFAFLSSIGLALVNFSDSHPSTYSLYLSISLSINIADINISYLQVATTHVEIKMNAIEYGFRWSD